MRLKSRTALVTGGSRGIGRAIALALGEEGADVAVNYVSSEGPARDVVENIKKMGRHAILAQADVGDYPDTFRMAQEVLREFGHLDILVNNAGINSDKSFVKMDHASWRKVFGRVEEVARSVVYICSADGDYITGAELSINGGLLM